MSKRNNKIMQKGSGLYAVLLSALIGIVILIILLSLFALIIANSNINLDSIKYFNLIALLISGFSASVISAYLNRQLKGLLIGLLTCCVISMLFLISAIIINNGVVSSFTLIISILAVIIGIPGGIIGANLKQ